MIFARIKVVLRLLLISPFTLVYPCFIIQYTYDSCDSESPMAEALLAKQPLFIILHKPLFLISSDSELPTAETLPVK